MESFLEYRGQIINLYMMENIRVNNRTGLDSKEEIINIPIVEFQSKDGKYTFDFPSVTKRTEFMDMLKTRLSNSKKIIKIDDETITEDLAKEQETLNKRKAEHIESSDSKHKKVKLSNDQMVIAAMDLKIKELESKFEAEKIKTKFTLSLANQLYFDTSISDRVNELEIDLKDRISKIESNVNIKLSKLIEIFEKGEKIMTGIDSIFNQENEEKKEEEKNQSNEISS